MRVWSDLQAARATFALNAAEWLRRGRLIFIAPWRLRRLFEQNFTYAPVRFSGATSPITNRLRIADPVN